LVRPARIGDAVSMPRNHPPEIHRFLAVGRFAVVGASNDRSKYGNKVLRCYQQHGLPVVGVNPKLTEVEGARCVPSLRDVGPPAVAVSVVAPPAAAASIVADAQAAGVRHLWFQPGAEQEQAIAAARAAGIEVIAHGPCVLVALGYREDA
jgi:predicted CoA-binding protein